MYIRSHFQVFCVGVGINVQWRVGTEFCFYAGILEAGNNIADQSFTFSEHIELRWL